MKTAIMIGILLLFCFTVSFAANIEVMVTDKQSQGVPEYEILSQYLAKVSDISISDLGVEITIGDILFFISSILFFPLLAYILTLTDGLNKKCAILCSFVGICVVLFVHYYYFVTSVWTKPALVSDFSVEIKSNENGESYGKTARLTDFRVKDDKTIIRCENVNCTKGQEIKQTEFLVLVAKDLPKVVVIKPSKDKALALAVSDKK